MNDKKAILFIFSQPWCGACTRLKANFMEDGEKLLDISKDFLLINVGGDDNNKFGVRIRCLEEELPVALFTCS